MPRLYSKQSILHTLDTIMLKGPYYFGMDLEHGYFCTANSRLSLFANDTTWAIVFEKSGFANRAGEIQLELAYYGNDLQLPEDENGTAEACEEKPTSRFGRVLRSFANRVQSARRYPQVPQESNVKTVTLVDGDGLNEVEDGNESEMLAATADHIKLRGRAVPIPNRKEDYVRWIPDIKTREYPQHVSFEDIGRYLAFKYADECRATMEEVREYLPDDLPFIMHIDEWHQKSHAIYDDMGEIGEKPSSYETFHLIADVLLTGDPTSFRPTLPPNNHWTNWPEAGGL